MNGKVARRIRQKLSTMEFDKHEIGQQEYRGKIWNEKMQQHTRFYRWTYFWPLDSYRRTYRKLKEKYKELTQSDKRRIARREA